MMHHYIIDCLYGAKLGLKLLEIGLQDFDLDVVHVVLAKLKHAMSESIGLLKNALDITLFGRLVLEPDLLEMLLGILTLEQVAEDKLILVDGLFRHD